MAIFNESVTQGLTGLTDEAVGWPRIWDSFGSNFLELSQSIGLVVEFDRAIVDTLALSQTVQDFLANFYEPMSDALSLSDIATYSGTFGLDVVESLDLEHLLLIVFNFIDTLALTHSVIDGTAIGRDTIQSLSLAQVIDDTLLHPEDHVLTLSDTVAPTVIFNRDIVHSCVLTQHVEGWIVGAVPECTTEKWPETGDPTLDVCP